MTNYQKKKKKIDMYIYLFEIQCKLYHMCLTLMFPIENLLYKVTYKLNDLKNPVCNLINLIVNIVKK